MLVYLLVPVALAIVFFTMSFLQKDKVEKAVDVIKQKTKKAIKKAPLPKKLTSKIVDDKPLQSKGFVEEQDIKEYASIQGPTVKSTPVVQKTVEKKEDKASKKDEKTSTDKKSEKKDEKKTSEKKDEKKGDKKSEKKEEIVSPASPDDKPKKQKKTDWVTQPQKPQRKVPEKKEEEETTTEEGAEKKEKKDRKEGDRKFKGEKREKGEFKGEKRGDRKKGDKKEDGEQKPKSIYKEFKPHGADADKEEVKAAEDATAAPEKTETEAPVEGEKKEKRERKERTERPERPKYKGPKMVQAHEAYASADDFWDTNLKDTYKEPVTEVAPIRAAPVSSDVKSTSPVPKSERAPKSQGVKVNTSAPYTGKTWQSNSPVSTVEETQEYPALGAKAKKSVAPKKKDSAVESETTEEPQKKSDSHKREVSDILFEYENEAPQDKKIKLGVEAQQQPERQEETFVLPDNAL